MDDFNDEDDDYFLSSFSRTNSSNNMSAWGFSPEIQTDADIEAEMFSSRGERLVPGPPLPSHTDQSGNGSGSASGSVLREQLTSSAPSIFGSIAGHEASVPATVSSSESRLPSLRTPPSRAGQQYTTETRRLPAVVKDADDPRAASQSSALSPRNRHSHTINTLSRLFQATSPGTSRNPSYMVPPRHPSAYVRSRQSETTALPDHLYTRGLLSGKHSDITVIAFGQRYKLHRLILDRSPFFASALSEPWLEAQAKEMTVHPEDIDSSITKASFELALKRLYGHVSSEETKDPAGLFATACWLEMRDLVDSSIESMLRQMTTQSLSPLINLVTANYYGRAGDKVLASAKSMLCRDGWKMPLKLWDGIPGDVIREIVGGDGFFIDGEWERWLLAKRILDRRLKLQALASGLVEPGNRRKVQKAPEAANLLAVRFDAVYRRTSVGTGRVHDSLHKWITLYTSPDVEPLLVLLDEGIHYIHLDFEQLQLIRSAKDCLGLPVMAEKVISNALWQQMELRQKVINARESELVLGLSVQCNDEAEQNAGRESTMSIAASSDPERPKGKRKVSESDEIDDIDSGSWDGNGKPRKFWIPSSDCNIVMGGSAEPIIATASSTQNHASRLSATLHPEDVQWATDFAAASSRPSTEIVPADGPAESAAVNYTKYPPFRFAAEFPNPRLLKEKKRVYSRTVFYCGSLWNIYVQRVASRNKQLGVYLHRVDSDGTESTVGTDDAELGSGAGASNMRVLLARGQQKSGQTDILSSSPPSASDSFPGGGHASLEDSDSDMGDRAETEQFAKLSSKRRVPTLPPYVDARPTIKTYFKIYSPSRGGRMLSVYESAPDLFNYAQSWGWKSSTLMLDEGMTDEDGEDTGETFGEKESSRRAKLKFMVVIGNI